ncbi:diaminopimelate epimerase [Helicobacter sp.]|uniref:diaminopimelate epimerase n=1 Tax=Helicobacter sp. TaxID=218 RepID=UPI0025B899CE|nr:diaminopimelate epimerase [Helicobacter sp.]MCI5968566.1 diaminopimelate epimerase [Helicobacter sp.]MDY2584341.1 diaminopimelate epimerase [Helicobacter sp.]
MFFSKYSASGNDFIITHTFGFQENFWGELAKKICHRQEGVGADGLIVLKPHSAYDFEWEFYNADGSAPKMCGNGSRAAALYARDFRLASSVQKFLTGAGVIDAEIFDEENFKKLESKILVESALTKAKVLQKNIQEYGVSWWLIDTGVPHLVCENAHLNKEELRALRHKYNANVNIATLEQDCVRARTFERGVEDETLACGTGMAAMFYYLKEASKVPNPCCFKPASNEELFLREEKGRIFLKGSVRKICDFVY